jgi:hypothetical protein
VEDRSYDSRRSGNCAVTRRISPSREDANMTPMTKSAGQRKKWARIVGVESEIM